MLGDVLRDKVVKRDLEDSTTLKDANGQEVVKMTVGFFCMMYEVCQ